MDTTTFSFRAIAMMVADQFPLLHNHRVTCGVSNNNFFIRVERDMRMSEAAAIQAWAESALPYHTNRQGKNVCRQTNYVAGASVITWRRL